MGWLERLRDWLLAPLFDTLVVLSADIRTVREEQRLASEDADGEAEELKLLIASRANQIETRVTSAEIVLFNRIELLAQRFADLQIASAETRSAIERIAIPEPFDYKPEFTRLYGMIAMLNSTTSEAIEAANTAMVQFPRLSIEMLRVFSAVDYAADKFDRDPQPSGERTDEIVTWARKLMDDRKWQAPDVAAIRTMLEIRDIVSGK
jgi:hypothetical protein